MLIFLLPLHGETFQANQVPALPTAPSGILYLIHPEMLSRSGLLRTKVKLYLPQVVVLLEILITMIHSQVQHRWKDFVKQPSIKGFWRLDIPSDLLFDLSPG